MQQSFGKPMAKKVNIFLEQKCVPCADTDLLVTQSDSCQQSNFTCHFLFSQVPGLFAVNKTRRSTGNVKGQWTESYECH